MLVAQKHWHWLVSALYAFHAIRVHQAGFPNVVATLGGHISHDNLNLLNRYEKQFQLAKEAKSILKEKDLQEISKLIQNYNDLYNKTVESAKNIPRFVDCPVNHAEISKSEGELEDKINRVFVEAEKRSMEENKKKETAQHAVPDDGTAGPNISDKNKKDKDRMNLD